MYAYCEIVDYVSSTERFKFVTERLTGLAEGETCITRSQKKPSVHGA